VLAWLWVVESYQALGWQLPVNIKFILEGMEESGSEGLDEFIYAHRDWFKDVDYSCISDNYWLGPRKVGSLAANARVYLNPISCSHASLTAYAAFAIST
jgi:acetylornithine deacetylase/succinyl-diaminopimelate desuccinylase-like protein